MTERALHQDHAIPEHAERQPHDNDQPGDAAQARELIAHFRSAAQARQAAHALHDRVLSARVVEVAHSGWRWSICCCASAIRRRRFCRGGSCFQLA